MRHLELQRARHWGQPWSPTSWSERTHRRRWLKKVPLAENMICLNSFRLSVIYRSIISYSQWNFFKLASTLKYFKLSRIKQFNILHFDDGYKVGAVTTLCLIPDQIMDTDSMLFFFDCKTIYFPIFLIKHEYWIHNPRFSSEMLALIIRIE